MFNHQTPAFHVLKWDDEYDSAMYDATVYQDDVTGAYSVLTPHGMETLYTWMDSDDVESMDALALDVIAWIRSVYDGFDPYTDAIESLSTGEIILGNEY